MSSICCFGEPHLRLMEFLVRKHAASYREHVLDVLLAQDQRIGTALHENDALERHIAEWLLPEVQRREEELRMLEGRLVEHQQRHERDRLLEQLLAEKPAGERLQQTERELHDLRAALAEAQAALTAAVGEVQALRASRSWKITAPLRAAQDLLIRPRTRA
jgi:hypothetical protein